MWAPNGLCIIFPSVRPVEESAVALELAHPARSPPSSRSRPSSSCSGSGPRRSCRRSGPSSCPRVDVPERGRYPSLRHHGVGLPEKRLADDECVCAPVVGLDRRPQPAPPAPTIRTSQADRLVGCVVDAISFTGESLDHNCWTVQLLCDCAFSEPIIRSECVPGRDCGRARTSSGCRCTRSNLAKYLCCSQFERGLRQPLVASIRIQFQGI